MTLPEDRRDTHPEGHLPKLSQLEEFPIRGWTL